MVKKCDFYFFFFVTYVFLNFGTILFTWTSCFKILTVKIFTSDEILITKNSFSLQVSTNVCKNDLFN